MGLSASLMMTYGGSKRTSEYTVSRVRCTEDT